MSFPPSSVPAFPQTLPGWEFQGGALTKQNLGETEEDFSPLGPSHPFVTSSVISVLSYLKGIPWHRIPSSSLLNPVRIYGIIS